MVCLVAALVVVLCLTSSTTSAIGSRAQRSGFGSAQHVIIFGCDGFGTTDAKNLLRVQSPGSAIAVM